MKNSTKKKQTVQDVMIEKYVDEECDNVNKLYPVMSNGERNWTNYDRYIKKYNRYQTISHLIETEILDDYIIKTDKKVKRISGEGARALLFSGVLTGFTVFTAVLSKGNQSFLDACTVLSFSLVSVVNFIEGIVKSVKAKKLAKHVAKIDKEWNELRNVPNYIEDFCKLNNIIVKDSPFVEVVDDVYIQRCCDEDLKVTTEERASCDEMIIMATKKFLELKNQERGE